MFPFILEQDGLEIKLLRYIKRLHGIAAKIMVMFLMSLRILQEQMLEDILTICL